MAVDAKLVMELRKITDLPMMQCKKALAETGGNIEKAVDLLRMQGAKMAEKKAHRETGDGSIGVYLHHNGKLGVMVELNCETDFVARNADFQELLKSIALHIAFHDPIAVKREDVPPEVVEKERAIILGQLNEDEKIRNKPDQVKEKIAEGKLDKFFSDRVLLEQPYVKDDKITVQELISQTIGKLKENITVGRFARYKVGEE
jgi:elongation factor Ts